MSKYFTDKEHRILLAALSRERKVCEEIEKNCPDGKVSLTGIVDSIDRKVSRMQSPEYSALNRLSDQDMEYCENLSSQIHTLMKSGQETECEKKRGKIRGYLEALVNAGILSDRDKKQLYLYYITDDRRKGETTSWKC